jgi:ribose transport system permease protein
MKKVLGILGMLVLVCALTGIQNPDFFRSYNLYNTLRWSALFAVLGVGVAFVIIAGGIDLSIGSVVGLVGSMLIVTLVEHKWPVPLGVAVAVATSALIGLAHGLLITKLKLQPFIVTLCGLLLYRGISRYITGDETNRLSGFTGLSYLAKGKPFSLPLPFLDAPLPVPMPLLILAAIAVLAAVLLNFTVWGRYLMAVGRNEQAARYSGIKTDTVTIAAYVLCSTLAGFGGVLFAAELNSIQPAALGEFYEVYAIAAAVLGGCSLRGGEGSILGVVIGATLLRVLPNAIGVLGIPTHIEFAIIGFVILIGVIADELVKRVAARRRATRQAVAAPRA